MTAYINNTKLEIVDWEDIEIGEIFGADGCFLLMQKRSKNKALIIAHTDRGQGFIEPSGHIHKFIGHIATWCGNKCLDLGQGKPWAVAPYDNLYKLPRRMQKMFVSNLEE